jgi:ubiquitin C-terminal hydrolase
MTPEVLDKSNQWHCEQCEKRVDALKGLKLKELPPIITLQLKRFDYHYSTMTRIKLNNRVSFPFYLDMGKYHKSDIDSQHTPIPTKRTPPSDNEEMAPIVEVRVLETALSITSEPYVDD